MPQYGSKTHIASGQHEFGRDRHVETVRNASDEYVRAQENERGEHDPFGEQQQAQAVAGPTRAYAAVCLVLRQAVSAQSEVLADWDRIPGALSRFQQADGVASIRWAWDPAVESRQRLEPAAAHRRARVRPVRFPGGGPAGSIHHWR